MTLELFSNILQLAVCIVAAIVTTTIATNKKTVEYTLAAGVLITLALGISYWLTYQFLVELTPQIFYVADISWIAAYTFLLALELYITDDAVRGRRHFAMYIHFPILLAITIYFCQWGDVLMNFAYMIPLACCAYLAIRNLIFGGAKARVLHIFCIVFIITEYALWIASCFWVSDTWTNPYFWFDFMITAEIALFLPIVRKAVD